jgi:hypothetical protein
MFMPRWAARLFLRVTSVRCERLQEISEADARVEGFEEWRRDDDCPMYYSAHDCFLIEWDRRFAKRGLGWETNPFVWVYDFEGTEA